MLAVSYMPRDSTAYTQREPEEHMTADFRRGSRNHPQVHIAQCGDCWNLWPREVCSHTCGRSRKVQVSFNDLTPSRTGEDRLLSFKSVNRGRIPYALPHFSDQTE